MYSGVIPHSTKTSPSR